MTCEVNDRLKLYFTLMERFYDTNERLKFILTTIKWDYDTNDRLKFILTMIKWDYGTNDRSKLALNKKMRSLMVEEWRWRCEKQEGTPKGA